MKTRYYLLMAVFLVSCSSVEEFQSGVAPNFKSRELAASDTDDFASEHLIANYSLAKSSNSNIIKDMKIRLSPFGGSISFKSPRADLINERGREIENEMDCRPFADSTEWICRSGCEGGYIKIRFAKDVKLDRIQVQPFSIKFCSGNEPFSDTPLKSRAPLNFRIQSVGLEK